MSALFRKLKPKENDRAGFTPYCFMRIIFNNNKKIICEYHVVLPVPINNKVFDSPREAFNGETHFFQGLVSKRRKMGLS